MDQGMIDNQGAPMKAKLIKLFIWWIITVFLLIGTLIVPGVASAEEGDVIDIDVETVVDCGDIEYTISWLNGSPPYEFIMDFGDGDATGFQTVDGNSITLNHTYIDQGDYVWLVQVDETSEEGFSGTASGTLILAGPTLTVNSDPPLTVFTAGDEGTVEFTAEVSGTTSYTLSWDLDGDGIDDGETGDVVYYTYSDVGKVGAQVMVTDECGFTDSVYLPVVVSDPENACHPTAQKIADAVNTIYPDQAEDLYTCEDIYDFFNGPDDGSNFGFGRMWKAYNLALTMEDLTWEDIRAWHLDVGGWGSLLQLNRFSELLENHSLPDLMALVMSDEYSLADVRIAVRSATRYEADFEDALSRIAEGANPGELGQFYQLAQDLEADPVSLDGYLADGLTLAELKQSAKLADRMEVDWTEIADTRTTIDSWGDIKQAYQLATDEVSATEILIIGVQQYKADLREDAKEDQQEKQATQQEEKNNGTGKKLAEQFTAEFGDVMNLFNGECEGNWGCVRKALREQTQTQTGGLSNHDIQTAQQIASKYGATENEVINHYQNLCGEDWTCTRSYFRNQYMENKVTGKPNKNK